ncbi:MAG: lipopolysaccharide transport periplasmic protein LptA [Gammaproteobacteria bacterium]|nr:MAG: lipopolysaccharide transport periplasmic protein LptA [Gammaproteobacteria bacterium]
MRHLNGLFSGLIIALLSTPLLALEKDREQPIQIEANSATFNEKAGTSTYTGDVKVTQGSFRFWSNRLTVYSKNDKMDKMIATGQPVKFRQTPEGQSEDIQGSALQMEYYGNKSLLIMLKEAKLWQGENITTSERIEYDNLNAIVQAGKKTSGSHRVKVILQPQQNTK